jgi:ABC-type branched-subunit amino acid transport system ATPase component
MASLRCRRRHVEVQRNGITALIGPNGRQDDVLQLLTGFDQPDTGRGCSTAVLLRHRRKLAARHGANVSTHQSGPHDRARTCDSERR